MRLVHLAFYIFSFSSLQSLALEGSLAKERCGSYYRNAVINKCTLNNSSVNINFSAHSFYGCRPSGYGQTDFNYYRITYIEKSDTCLIGLRYMNKSKSKNLILKVFSGNFEEAKISYYDSVEDLESSFSNTYRSLIRDSGPNRTEDLDQGLFDSVSETYRLKYDSGYTHSVE